MSILTTIKRVLCIQLLQDFVAKRKLKKEFMPVYIDFWFTGKWYSFGNDVTLLPKNPNDAAFHPGFLIHPQFNIFNGLVPVTHNGNYVALYEVTKGPYFGTFSQGGDTAPWDNGQSVDLKLAKVISMEDFKTKLKENYLLCN